MRCCLRSAVVGGGRGRSLVIVDHVCVCVCVVYGGSSGVTVTGDGDCQILSEWRETAIYRYRRGGMSY